MSHDTVVGARPELHQRDLLRAANVHIDWCIVRHPGATQDQASSSKRAKAYEMAVSWGQFW